MSDRGAEGDHRESGERIPGDENSGECRSMEAFGAAAAAQPHPARRRRAGEAGGARQQDREHPATARRKVGIAIIRPGRCCPQQSPEAGEGQEVRRNRRRECAKRPKARPGGRAPRDETGDERLKANPSAGSRADLELEPARCESVPMSARTEGREERAATRATGQQRSRECPSQRLCAGAVATRASIDCRFHFRPSIGRGQGFSARCGRRLSLMTSRSALRSARRHEESSRHRRWSREQPEAVNPPPRRNRRDAYARRSRRCERSWKQRRRR